MTKYFGNAPVWYAEPAAMPIIIAERGSENFVAALHLDRSQVVALRKWGKRNRVTIQECLDHWVDALLSKEKIK